MKVEVVFIDGQRRKVDVMPEVTLLRFVSVQEAWANSRVKQIKILKGERDERGTHPD